MSSNSAKQFDMLAFIHGLRERGVKEDLAEYQAKQLAQVIDIATTMRREEVHSQELATKTDIKQLEVNIKQLEVDLRNDIKKLEVDLRHDIKTLEVKLEQYRYDSLKFTIWTGIGVVIFLGGMLVKGFHWLA